jgi:hypothetical protein
MSRSYSRHDLRPSSRSKRHTGRGGERGGFQCRRCHQEVSLSAPGTGHRNHCPLCLWSVHLDDRPGDRRASCGGGMEPIAVWVRPDEEWALVHRCGTCRVVRVNRVAGDDNEMALLSLAARPMARPPFPVDR